MASIVTGIIGGIQGSSAAKNAANASGQGYINAGNMEGTAVGQAVDQYGQSGTQAENYTLGAASTAGQGATAAAQQAGAGATTAGAAAAAGLNPYAGTGAQATQQLAAGLAPGGNLSQTFTAADMDANDPGYQFRLQQGEQAIQRSLAAQGVSGGGAAKALNDYAQGQASSEYSNAFNRFTTNQQLNVQNLQAAANAGQAATTAQGQFGTQAAQYAGSQGTQAAEYAGTAGMQGAQDAAQAAMWAGGNQSQATLQGAALEGQDAIGKGNAQAAGDIGAANAWNSALSSIGNGVDSVITGGFGGGGGFSLLGAATGVPQFGGASTANGTASGAPINGGYGYGYNPDGSYAN